MWFFAFTFCWIYDRSAIAINNLVALLCYSTGKYFQILAKNFDNEMRLLNLPKVIIVSGPIFFIVTASLGWKHAFGNSETV